MANYLTYPVKVMNITQTYNGTTSHRPHWDYATPKDYPIDEACEDYGRSWFYCPCDEIEVKRVYGYQSSGINTVWLTSTTPCDLACGSRKIISMQVTHMNDDDLGKLYVGQRFKRGEKMFREGTDGATGNHFHISVGDGKIINGGWLQNSKSKWVLTTENGAYLPENAFWIDPNFTRIQSSGGLAWKKLSTSPQTSTATTTTNTTKIGGNNMTRGYFAQGDANEGVYALKQMLMALKDRGVISQGVDDNNIFGEGTKTAVEQVQAKAGIEVDGYAGPETLHACYKLLK